MKLLKGKFIPKLNLGWILLFILIVFILICYGVGIGVADEDDNPIDIIGKGFEEILASLVPDETAPDDDDDDDDGPLDWVQEVQVDGGTGSLDGGDMSNEFFGLGSMDPFSPGDGDIRIAFYYSWYISDENFDANDCSPGVVWCVHDSTGGAIFHQLSTHEGFSGPHYISGRWDGSAHWEVRVGNNCPCPIVTDWYLKIYRLS